MKYQNGDRYEGDWANDMRNGHGNLCLRCLGILTYGDKERYDGQWKDDKRAGPGIKQF